MVRIVDESGNTVVSYVYNAWGKSLSVTTNIPNTDIATAAFSNATIVAKMNPLRYRGYYYDTETGFYYLLSRYYDPAIGRFINADALASTGQGILGNNMFAYCNNNPVVLVDYSGMLPFGMNATQVVINDGGGGYPIYPYIANTPDEQIFGMVNGQSKLPYSDVRIGLGSYGKSGCPYIATYNAMQLIGKPQSLSSITSEMFRYGAVAFGAGGAGPWATAKYFDAHEIDYTGSFSADRLVANISEGSVIVFTVFYPTGWHAMTALYAGGRYLVFNEDNSSSTYKPYSSLENAFLNGVWIYGFRIN